MSKLSELRARANNTKEVQAQRAARIAGVVKDVVKDSSLDLSVGNPGAIVGSVSGVDLFAERVATVVCDVVSNPINSFLDTLQARGMTATRIVKTVGQLNAVFMLTESEDYEVQLKAVATYLENNPHLYDEIGMLHGTCKNS